jgi:glycosyltransferase involved in cell wall biosynthesis
MKTISRPPAEKPITVAHVTTVAMSLRHLLLHQLEAIGRSGYAPIGISAGGKDVASLEEKGIRHIVVPMTRAFAPLSDFVALVRLYRIMRRERFTIVHTHTPKGGLLGQYAALAAGVPLRLHTIHGLYLPEGVTPLVRRMFVLLERTIMAFSHHNFSQNAEDVDIAVREGICDPDRIELILNGIDLTEFDPSHFAPAQRRALRASLGLDDRHFVVGIVARLVRKKGYIDVLDAARLMRDRAPNVRFLCIGPIEPEKNDAVSPAAAKERGVDDIVHFLGHRADIPELLSIMDAFTLASHHLEGFPRAAMEAAAMGVPSVVTDVKGCRDAVEHDRTGYLVPPRNARALADALLALVENPEARVRFGEAGRAKALAEFDERVVFDRIVKRYAALLGSRKPRGTSEPAAGPNMG